MDYKEVIIKKRIRLRYSRNKLSQLIGISQPFINEIAKRQKAIVITCCAFARFSI